jgi:hypothetical protein
MMALCTHTPTHVSRYCVAMLALRCYSTNYLDATAPAYDLLSSVFSVLAYSPIVSLVQTIHPCVVLKKIAIQSNIKVKGSGFYEAALTDETRDQQLFTM